MASPINTIRKAIVTALEAAHLTCNGVEYVVQDCPVYGADPEEVPALQVSMTQIRGTKAVLTQQVYDTEYEIVVSALVGIDPDDDDDLSDVATRLADAMADADHDVKTALLPSWRTWAAGADKIECGESKLLAAGEGSGHYGRVDIPIAVSMQTRYGTVPTGSNKVHVEISPIPKTTAGWEE